jgi:hypothetical protein
VKKKAQRTCPVTGFGICCYSATALSLRDVHATDASMTAYVGLSAWLNSRTAGRIWMKFGIDVTSLVFALKSYNLLHLVVPA